MQEQHHYNTTPEQGWSSMLRVLDQEMPLAQRQRRFILFWWASAAVITAAIIAAFVLLNNNHTQLPTVSQHEVRPQTGIENTQKTPTQDDKASVVTPEESIAQTGLQNVVKDQHNTLQNKDIQKNIRSEKSATSPRSSMVIATEENIIVSESLVTEEAIDLNSQGVAVTEPAEVSINDVDRSSVIDQSRMDEVIASLPLVEIAAFSSEAELMDDIEPGKISKFGSNRKSMITPHLSAGMILGFSNGIGVQGAVGADINVLPRLSLTADVGYNIYSPDASLFGCACDEEDFIDTDGVLRNDLGYHGIGEYIPAETVNAWGGSLNSFVTTIRQWQISAGLKYDLSRRFYAHGGIAMGFGTTAHSAYPIIAFDNSATSGDFLSISHSFKNVIKSSSTSVFAGIGYRLSPRIELYANATHSFDHYFQTEQSYGVASPERNDYIRGMNVGLRYNFQGP